jgi:hypothetical protein
VTPAQQTLIRESWAQVAPIADTAATIFYGRLFELDPSLRDLFSRTDMASQRRNLMQTLAVVVASIDRLESIVPVDGTRVTASRPPTSIPLGRRFSTPLRSGSARPTPPRSARPGQPPTESWPA